MGIDKLTVNYKYDYSAFQDLAYGGQAIGYAPNALSTLLGPNAFYPGSGPAYVPAAPGSYTPSFNRLGALALPFQSDPANYVQGHTLTLEYELNSDLRLKNIASYRQLYSPSWQDLDGGALVTGPAYAALGVPEGIPACLSCSYNAMRQHQITEEAQLLGNYGPLNFTSGFFFFHENSSYLLAYGQGKGPIFPTPTPNVFTPTDLAFGEDGNYVNSSFAGYVHADYAFTDWLKLAVGGRYTTDDRKTADLRGLVVTGNIAAPYAFGGAVTQGDVTYHRFNYDVALDFQLSPDAMAYTKYSTGYLSGGIQGSHPFMPQDTQQVEVGLKSEWLDRRLRVNGAAYNTWTQNRQEVIINQGEFPDLPLGLVYTNEVGTTKIAGFELETAFKPIQPLTLTANYGFNNPRYPDGARALAAKETFSFSSQYDFPAFSNRSHFLILFDGDYRSRYFAQNVNYDTSNGFIATAPIPANLYQALGYASQEDYLAAVFKASQAGGYWLLNARLALVDLSIGKTVGRISAFVRNLADERDLSYASLSGATVDGTYERPRTYGIELNFDFN
jgi:iron complex outermembrane receptor protein